MKALGALALALLLGGGIAAGLAWRDFDAHQRSVVVSGDEPASFTVERGWTARRVGVELEARGLVDSARWFDLGARLDGRGARIKAGEFAIEPGTTAGELVGLFAAGRTVQYRHTIVEGSTFVETLARLGSAERLEATLELPELAFARYDEADPALIDAARAEAGRIVMAALDAPDVPPEGRFFADTYAYPAGTTDVQFLARAKRRLETVLAEEWSDRDASVGLDSAEDALTLASIVEKETADPAERPLIAGVFLSRLELGMRLQTDPTVIYGIGAAYDGDIRRKDLTTDTPWNTYTRGGLPSTPIAMVGREAIHAVLHPEATSSLYFVSRGDGTHVFSETLEAHQEAVRTYQLNR